MAFPTARQSHRRRDGESEVKGYRVATIYLSNPRLRIEDIQSLLAVKYIRGNGQGSAWDRED